MLSEAQKRVLAWMADGDRAVYQYAPHDAMRYGFYQDGKHVRLCSRRTCEILVEGGYAEWMPDCPDDLRIMIIPAGRAALED